MLSFKRYIKEDLSKVSSITAVERKKFNAVMELFGYTIDSSTSKTTTIIVRAPDKDRKDVKKDLESKLTKAGIAFNALRTGGSTGSTEVIFNNHRVVILYKPLSGGMSETTLNSTITELVPALVFMSGKKRFTKIEDLYDYVSKITGNRHGVYLNDNDRKSGEEFIKQMPSSSKFKEKMENAIAVTKYLDDLDKESKIQNVYWGYRVKPEGIDKNHKGDIFVKFTSGEMLGVSLKAGGETTKEPQLNTYVNKFFDDIGYAREKEVLMSMVYKNIHSKLGLPENWASSSQKTKSINTIEAFKEKKPREYEKMYDDMLDMIRNAVVDAVNKNKSKTIEYIKSQVLKKDENVPLIVIKAINTTYKQVTDEDQLGVFLPQVIKVTAYSSPSSKQNWFIDLSSKKDKITMNMSVRSNKPEPENKIAQGFNLAVKFNGITT